MLTYREIHLSPQWKTSHTILVEAHINTPIAGATQILLHLMHEGSLFNILFNSLRMSQKKPKANMRQQKEENG